MTGGAGRPGRSFKKSLAWGLAARVLRRAHFLQPGAILWNRRRIWIAGIARFAPALTRAWRELASDRAPHGGS